jgi:hypothetical protein
MALSAQECNQSPAVKYQPPPSACRYCTGVAQMQRLTRTLTFAVMVIAASPAPAAQIRWQQIVDREAGFIVSFPGQPAYRETTAEETGLPFEVYSFYYNGNLLQVTFQPIEPAPRTALEVNQVLSDSARVYAGGLIRQEKLPGGGRQLDNLLETKSGALHLRTRLYVHRGKLFGLSCGSYEADGIDEGIAGQFFSSLQFYRLPDRPPCDLREASVKGFCAQRREAGALVYV